MLINFPLPSKNQNNKQADEEKKKTNNDLADLGKTEQWKRDLHLVDMSVGRTL